MKNFTIAIDGYSSCGKSTLAKALAKHYNFVFIDSGAMYRAVCLFALRNNWISEQINPKLIEQLNKIDIQFGPAAENGERPVFLNNENVSHEIRQMHVAQHVSKIATIKEIRTFLVHLQRNYQKDQGVVMDGRDIGTVVFPNAEIKLFLTASPDVRAQRRFLELNNAENVLTIEQVKSNLLERDKMDETREESPLKMANDAILIDNSDMSQEEQFMYTCSIIHQKMKI